MRRRLATLFAVGALLTGMLATSGIVLAANQGANLDQCANDPAPSSHLNGCATNANQWVNGNLGASKSVYVEGDSIPYRMTFSNLVTGGATFHHLIIEWDTTKGGTHALDYLTTWNASVADANPCLGINGSFCTGLIGGASTIAIPKDPQVDPGTPTGTGAVGGQPAGQFALWGGTITSITGTPSNGYSYSNGTGFTGDKSASIQINFTATVANPVLAWGGHIATRQAWGPLNSAVTIPGSPYHTRLISLDGAGGNQDRSLSADAVIFPGSITIIKDVVGGTDPQDFAFTESASTTLPPSTFTLDDDPGSLTPTNTQSYSNIQNFIAYTFDEGAVANWSLSFNNPPCVVTSPNGGTQPLHSTTGVTINLKEGENVTCTFRNTHNFNTTGLSTTPSETAGSIGDTLTDSATLTGATSGAGGTISFYLFAPGATCDDVAPITGFVYSSTGVPVSGNGTYQSSAGTTKTGSSVTTMAGTYTWVAVYSGDGNNTDAKSGCGSENVVIAPNTTGLSTTPSETAGSIGDTLTDSGTLSGATSGAGGTIDFYLFAPGATCDDVAPITGFVYSSTGVPVSGNGTYQSSDGTESGSNVTTGVGTYTWVAVYSGDGNNTDAKSGCGSENVVIAPNTTHLSTTTNETSGSIGDTLTDSATLTGATSGATGTIDFYLFAPGATCDDTLPIAGYAYKSTGVPVSGNGTYDSADGTGSGSNVTTGTGTYTWVAVFTDGANNTASQTNCGDEDVVINPNTPGLTTNTDPDSGNIGDTLTDSATLSGATSDAGGTIDFYLFAPGTTCSTDGTGAIYSSTGVPVSGDDTYLSTAGTEVGSNVTTQAGTYTWIAVYSGDGNNTGTNTSCGDEDVVISPNSPTLSTTPDPASGKIGDALGDSADLSGETADATGNITFWLFAPGDSCADTSTAVYTEVVASSGGSATTTGTGTGDNTATQAGTYHWAAHYAGDGNNDPADSACGDEPVTIAKNNPDVSTIPNLLPNDEVVISGLTANATGVLTVALHTNADCTGSAIYTQVWDSALSGVHKFTGNGTYDTTNTSVFVTASETIRWCTTYSGDSNNEAFGPSDKDEVMQIVFNPVLSGTALGFAIPMLLWGFKNRKRRNAKD